MNSESTNLDVIQLLRILRRRAPVILLCVVLTGVAAFAASKHQRKEYTASAGLYFRSAAQDQEAAGLQVIAPANPQPETDTNLKLATLPSIAERTATAVGRGLTAGRIRTAVSVSQESDTNLASVAATWTSPSLAARIANVYARQVIAGNRRTDQSYYANALQAVNLQIRALTPVQQNGVQGADLRDRANSLQVLSHLQSSDVQLVQPASVPTSPSSPLVTRNTALGLILGLLLGVGLALLLERLDRRLMAASAVEQAFGMPILAAIQHSPAYETNPTHKVPPAAVAETFGLLRARLRYFNADRDLRSLLITSGSMGEGKSVVSLHLAIAEAMSGGSEVVLVEADLRRPSLAQKVGARSSPGLAEAISRNVTLDDALQEVVLPGRLNGSGPATSFQLIAGGAIPPNPAELVESQSMRQLLGELAERFDLVIIDSPPLAVVSDAIPLVSQVSGVVVVCRVGKTTRDAAKHLRNELLKLDAPTLGVVANDIRVKGGSYGYGYGYSGGYESKSDSTNSGAIADQSVGPEGFAANGQQVQERGRPAGINKESHRDKRSW